MIQEAKFQTVASETIHGLTGKFGNTEPGASFIKKARTINRKLFVRSFF